MDIEAYKRAALRTDFATYDDYHTGDVSPRLDYAVTGLVTESAKLLDIIKKSKKNLAPLSIQAINEELGDLLWYLNLTLDELQMSYEELMAENLRKIEQKYPREEADHNGLIRG